MVGSFACRLEAAPLKEVANWVEYLRELKKREKENARKQRKM